MMKIKKKVILIIIAVIAIIGISAVTLLLINGKYKGEKNTDSQLKKQLLLQHTYKDVKELYSKVKSLDNFVDICQGDIGNDGANDVAVICQRVDQIPPKDYDLWDEQRILCIYTETEEGQYSLKYTNGNLISEEGSGGMVGDPHQGMEIKDGVLEVRELKGSAEKWGKITYWGYINNEFVLCKYIDFEHHGHTGNGIDEIYDFETGKVEKYATCYEHSDLLIYRGTFENSKIKFGDEVRFDRIESYGNYLPDMNVAGCFDYFGERENTAQVKNASINGRAIEALDKVKKNKYPDMKKVEMDYDEEIYKNIEYLLSYEIPRYYYENDDGEVLYFDFVSLEDGKLVYNMRHSTDGLVELSD